MSLHKTITKPLKGKKGDPPGMPSGKPMAFSDYMRIFKPQLKDVKYEDIDWGTWKLYRDEILTLGQFDEWMASNKSNFFSDENRVKRRVKPKVAVVENEVQADLIKIVKSLTTMVADLRKGARSMGDEEYIEFSKQKLEAFTGTSFFSSFFFSLKKI